MTSLLVQAAVVLWSLAMPRLAATSDDGWVWLAVNRDPPILVRREIGGDEQWQFIRTLPTPAVSLAGGGDEAAVLLADGRWFLAGPARWVEGPAPPERLGALAGRPRRLIGFAGDATYRFTNAWRPATLPARPLGRRVAGQLPPGTDAMAVTTDLLRRTSGGEVEDIPIAAEPFDAAVWVGGTLRLLSLQDGEIREQRFDLDGTSRGASAFTVPTERPPPPATSPSWLVLALIAMLALSWGRPPVLFDVPSALRPASLVRRGIGGAVDLALGFAPVLIIFWAVDLADWLRAMPLIVAAGMVLSSVVAGAVEVGTGRSPGKWLAGLRVVDMDGNPAGRRALVTRGVLRAVDVWPVLPLIILVRHPLRQRLGDVTANTLVVRSKPADEPATDEGQ